MTSPPLRFIASIPLVALLAFAPSCGNSGADDTGAGGAGSSLGATSRASGDGASRDGTAGNGASGSGSSGSGSSGASDGPVSGPAPQVFGFSVEPNPNNTLSAFVSWTTDVPADSAVEFGQGGYQFVLRDGAAVTTHRVLVVGMRADSSYELRAVSTTTGGSGSATGTFTTGSLPITVPMPELTVSESGHQEGWTVVSVQPEGAGFGSDRPPGVFVMYDDEGVPVWYYVNGDQPEQLGDASVNILPNGNLLLGPNTYTAPKEIDLAGEIVWRGPEQPDGGGDGTPGLLTHQAKKLGNGNYVLLRNELDADGFEGARIEEVTPANEVVWSWSLFDHLQPDPETDDEDWCHPNSVTVDEADDAVYLSCRWLGVIKARRSGDQEILWTLGEGLDGGTFGFDPEGMGFADQHDPELHDDGTILIFDNGGYAPFSNEDFHTRVLEYALDESSRVATLVWSFPGEFAVDTWYRDDWYTPFWGDADRLGNGNVLITAGLRSSADNGRIFEVSREGEVVWELRFPLSVGTYQADRISPAPARRL